MGEPNVELPTRHSEPIRMDHRSTAASPRPRPDEAPSEPTWRRPFPLVDELRAPLRRRYDLHPAAVNQSPNPCPRLAQSRHVGQAAGARSSRDRLHVLAEPSSGSFPPYWRTHLLSAHDHQEFQNLRAHRPAEGFDSDPRPLASRRHAGGGARLGPSAWRHKPDPGTSHMYAKLLTIDVSASN